MIPYASFLYFGVLLYVVVPTLILGLAGRASWRWILIATVGMLAVQYRGTLDMAPGVDVRECWIVAGYALFQWAVALGFLHVRARTNRRWLFYTALLASLLPLAATKYAPLVAPHFHFGFLGISYVTFRALDAIICIQDRLIRSLPPGQFLAYLFFFATISSGPIDRYRRFETDWQRRRTRAEFLQDLDGAADRIFTGFLYKFVLAALIKQYWLDPAAAQAGVASTLSYMYAYSFYLFFDFAGYSAFAIGVSYLFGVHTPENFDRPFLARNIRDFWNRWHITLSWWIRDHVYMRFVMAATKGRWFKSKYVTSYLGFLLAFGLMGAWHGTAPHFLLYGLYHGVLLSTHEAFARWNKQHGRWRGGPLWQTAGIFGTFHLVCFGFLLLSGRLTGAGDAPRASASSGAYEGRVEKARCEEIGGWAWDAAHPDTPVDVEIRADGTRLATVRADLFRRDLADAGKGNGAHGFVYVPPAPLKDERPHAIAVTIAGTAVELAGERPRSLVCAMTVDSMDGREGSHESTDCELASGWAWDATRPDRPVSVDVYADRVLLGSVAADQLRADLHGRGHGNGRYGFAYPIPAALKDGRPHSIAVRISGTNVTLRDTPQVVTCSGSPDEMRQAQETDQPTQPATEGTAPHTAAAGGTEPRYVDNGDGTISELNSGLMWEKKVKLDGVADAANLHDADNCYPWAGKCTTGGAECRSDADCRDNGPCQAADCQTPAPDGLTIFKWVARLNAARFAGHDDWRVPRTPELYTIVNPLEERNPAVIAAFEGTSCGAACGDLSDPACSCTNPGLHWAAPASGPQPDDAWMMYFYCMGKLFLDTKNNTFHVRAVRGGL